MAALIPKETGLNASKTLETGKLVVSQPQKLQELNMLLESMDALDRRVSERVGEDRSQDLGAAGATGGAQQGTQTVSPRDQAIAAMPTSQAALRRDLTRHIEREVRSLQTLAERTARKAARPGGAFHLNEIYARIRRLNALLAELVEASMEVLRRLFIRVFIDKQSIM